MQASKLINQWAVRNGPTRRGDMSYTTDPLLITGVFENHITCRRRDSNSSLPGPEHILNKEWLDDMWQPVHQLQTWKLTHNGYILHQGTEQECSMIYNAICKLSLSHRESHIDSNLFRVDKI